MRPIDRWGRGPLGSGNQQDQNHNRIPQKRNALANHSRNRMNQQNPPTKQEPSQPPQTTRQQHRTKPKHLRSSKGLKSHAIPQASYQEASGMPSRKKESPEGPDRAKEKLETPRLNFDFAARKWRGFTSQLEGATKRVAPNKPKAGLLWPCFRLLWRSQIWRWQ